MGHKPGGAQMFDTAAQRMYTAEWSPQCVVRFVWVLSGYNTSTDKDNISGKKGSGEQWCAETESLNCRNLVPLAVEASDQ